MNSYWHSNAQMPASAFFYMRKIYLYLFKLLMGFLMLTAKHIPRTTHHIPEVVYARMNMTKSLLSRHENLIVIYTIYYV